MLENLHTAQASLEREMKRKRVPLWGAGYPLHDLEEITRIDPEPGLKRTKEVERDEISKERPHSRWRMTLNLIRLSLE